MIGRVCWVVCGCFLILSNVGCGGNEAPRPYDGSKRRLPSARSAGYTQQQVVTRLPWEIWPLNADLNGRPLDNSVLAAGDDLYRKGDRVKALETYQLARDSKLTPQLEMAAVFRVAALELTLDRPARALQSLSTFFRAAGGDIEAVDGRFSLLFGYTYGRSNDVDQAFAWLSRAARESKGGPLAEIATAGVRYFLQRIGDDRWLELTRVWESDLLVSRLISDEKKRREAGGQVITALTGGPSWWEGAVTKSGEVASGTEQGAAVMVSQATLGAVLPLSGKYATLGTQLKNGMDLAAIGISTPERQVSIAAIDSGDTSASAVAATKTYLASGAQPVVLGPLIAEHVAPVADLVRSMGATMMHLAKRGDTPVGPGVFRLGVTVRSQMESLLDAARNVLHLQRIALVYPADSVGAEYLEAFRGVMAEQSVPSGELLIRAYAREELDGLVTIAQEFETLGIDGVVLPDTIDVASRFFAAFDARYRSRIRPLGLALWDNAQGLANSQVVMNGAVFVSPFFAESQRPVVREFIESYQSRFGVKPDFLAALGFDAVTLMGRGLEASHNQEGSTADGLEGLGEYDGLTGRLSVRPEGEIRRQYVTVILSESGLAELGARVEPVLPN